MLSLANALRTRYSAVRHQTEALAAPLSAEDQVVQSMPDVSPTKWHRAHTTWFFETFVLDQFDPDHQPFDPAFGFLFNSYYETVGARHPRPQRGLISRPSVAEVGDYRAAVDASIERLFDHLDRLGDDDQATVLELIELGLHHEQQHQELILMDIKHVLSVNPIEPAYRSDRAISPAQPAPALSWTDHSGGIQTIGHPVDGGFAFDSETPRHDVLLQPFQLANRLVTCGEWLEFMGDRGYHQATLWLSDGWHHICSQSWEAPAYWFAIDGEWHIFTLDGVRPLDPAEPVVHVSLYEADAYARWAGARLPLEAEWEVAAAGASIEGDFVGTDPSAGPLHPTAASGAGLQQLYGQVWQWTSSPYTGYPGFTTAPGAVGEYNGKFMSNQMVLRGGCCATPEGHTRSTYRNFFPPHSRWMFSGVRLAKDAQ
ncbi:MAG: ergothioneine biosynthesis protein EgtB [Actinomycetota bacterium]|jgi:ergothioneine biosynthesis protein EgtB|nr:ergothioneine biosynthesis protein EgtB [Actinomycetota bacterium]